MTRFIILFFLFASLSGMSQMTVVIVPSDTIVCFRDSVACNATITNPGPGADTAYLWQLNGVNIPWSDTSLFYISSVSAKDTGFYRCIVSVGLLKDTSNTFHLRMHPQMKIDTLYRYNALGCPDDCKGQFKVKVSEGTPFGDYPYYIYDWHGGHSQDTIVFGLCKGKYIFSVTDSMECRYDSAYVVDVLKAPKVDFDRLPGDTVYLTNPNLTVVFQDSSKPYMTNWEWDFSEGNKVANMNPAAHSFTRTGTFPVRLSFTDANGCDTTISHDVVVKVVELKIPNVFTPNHDDVNETFEITIKGNATADWREAYISNEFIVLDRWGKKVYQQTNYRSGEWDGANLSDGTYFYILKCQGQFGDDVFKGAITILRGQGQN
jgi:gliding motility-associated-like protein